MDHQSTGNYR